MVIELELIATYGNCAFHHMHSRQQQVLLLLYDAVGNYLLMLGGLSPDVQTVQKICLILNDALIFLFHIKPLQ